MGTIKQTMWLAQGLGGTNAMWNSYSTVRLNITGCSLLKPVLVAAPISQHETCEAQQREIERLQQQLAEKEVLIRNLNARQQDQAKALQETTSQVTRDQVRLRRLATQPGAASPIAEAEVAMASLKSSQITSPAQLLGK